MVIIVSVLIIVILLIVITKYFFRLIIVSNKDFIKPENHFSTVESFNFYENEIKDIENLSFDGLKLVAKYIKQKK